MFVPWAYPTCQSCYCRKISGDDQTSELPMTRVILATLIFLLTSGPGLSQELSMNNPVSFTLIPPTVPKPTCGYPCNRIAVIFVHGITGDSKTWKNGEVEWPKLLADDSGLQNEI